MSAVLPADMRIKTLLEAAPMGTNPWTYILVFILVIMGGVIVLGTLGGLLMGFVASRYSVKHFGKHQAEIEKLLPGKDCGQCGFQSCCEYADAVLHTEAPEDACPYTKPGAAEAMIAVRERLQKSLEDPTPMKKKEPRFWERKF